MLDIDLNFPSETDRVLDVLSEIKSCRPATKVAPMVPTTSFISLEMTQAEVLRRVNQAGFLIGGERLT